MLGLTLALAGRLDEAIAVLRGDGRDARGGYVHAGVASATRSARAGRRAEAQAIYDELAANVAAGGYVSPVAFATILIGLGDVDGAIDWTERAFDDRRGWLVYLERESGARSVAWASAVRGAREADAACLARDPSTDGKTTDGCASSGT